MKNTELQRSARIANLSQETIDNEAPAVSDETKSASEMEKTLPDINPPRRITRSTSILDSKTDNKDGSETSPSLDKSEVKNVTTAMKHRTRSQSSEDFAKKNDTTDHPSPASVLKKISRIITRSQTTHDNGDKKEILNVGSKPEVDNRPTCRITRSHNIPSTVELSQPSVSETEPCQMRTRSQSSDKSEQSSKGSKNLDTSNDATLDVTVSLLNLNIDQNTKYIISPKDKKDKKITEDEKIPKLPLRKQRDSNEDSNEDVSKKKRKKKKESEDNKKETDFGNQTNDDNMDEMQPVNSDNALTGATSENSAATPTPTPNRMRTRSSKSTDVDPSRKASSQNTQPEI